jgi:formylglycine-generating enzyme required for sulfatase activity
MRLCNWMHNGQGDGDTETGAYNMSGGFYTERLSLATWAIASEDEWYKAAYYDPDAGVYYDYPNGTDDVPAEPIDQTSPRVFNFGDDPYWAPDGPLHRLYFTSTGDTTGRSPYGTYDQGGNAREWTDTMDIAPYRHYRYVRGGTLFTPESYLRSDTYNAYHPDEEGYFALRMVHLIPEPSTALLVLSGLLVMGLLRRRRG